MIIAFKEHNRVYIVKSRPHHAYRILDKNIFNEKEVASMYRLDQKALLVHNGKSRMLDLLIPFMHVEKKLDIDNFYRDTYIPYKAHLIDQKILDINFISERTHEDETIIFAQKEDFIVMKGFQSFIMGESIYADNYLAQVNTYFEFFKDLPIEKRLTLLFLDLMDHSPSNFFPLYITDTKTQEVNIITLKEALCL